MANRLNVANIGYNDATDALTIDSSGNVTAAGTLTPSTLDVSAGTLTLADDQISGDKVEGGTITSTTITSLTTGTISEAVADAGVSIDGVVAKDSKVFAPSGIVFASAEITGDDAGTTNRVESSNLLDDYEEGTWTANWTGLATAPTTPATATGYYTKIGNLVTCVVRFSNKDLTGAVGTMAVDGLPFDVKNTGGNPQGSCTFYGISLPALADYVTAWVRTTSNDIIFFSTISGSSWAGVQITSGTTKYMELTVTYFAS